MRERALFFGGEVVIAGETGKGTTVAVRVPGADAISKQPLTADA